MLRPIRGNLGKRTLAVALIAAFGWLSCSGDSAMAQTSKTRFSSAKDWNLKGENLAPHGVNPYHGPLVPGHRNIFEKPDHKDGGYYRKEIVVLDKTEEFDLPGIGKFECAIVQVEEFMDGVCFQQLLKSYCVDKLNNNVYCFGEISWEVDEDGSKIFDTTWRAGDPDANGVAEAGLLMPGTPLVGAKYIFEGSEGDTFGGAEIIETGVTEITPAGKFENCVRIRESSLTNPDEITDKLFAPGVGLIFDSVDGRLVASDSVKGTDVASFGKHHREPKKPVVLPVAKVTEAQATEVALKDVPGECTSIVIEKKLGKHVYVVEIVAKKDGAETDVFVDIETGKVIGVEK